MKIAITNHKGGTGKTTTAINLGRSLVSLKKKVLLVDLDPQGNLSYSLGIEDGKNIRDLFTDDVSFKDAINSVEGMDVLSSDMRLADIELTLQKVENRAFILKEILQNNIDEYDFVIFDCPPSRSLLTVNALCIADFYLVTILLDVLSIQGLNHILKTVKDIQKVYNSKLDLLGVLAVNVDVRKKITKEVWSFLTSNFDVPFFKTKIRTNVKVAEAPSHASSVIEYAPNCNASKDYIELAKEIIKNGTR